MKYLGCAYYPEYWGTDRLKIDAPLMREAGINLVRIGEFAWSRMEGREGAYTLDWLHQTADVMAAHDIDVLMCTPTATPPAWLTQKHPEIREDDGHRQRHLRRSRGTGGCNALCGCRSRAQAGEGFARP